MILSRPADEGKTWAHVSIPSTCPFPLIIGLLQIKLTVAPIAE